jgi:hypothetical protein
LQIRSENWGIPDGVHLFAGTKYQENDDLRYGYERNVRGKSTSAILRRKKSQWITILSMAEALGEQLERSDIHL